MNLAEVELSNFANSLGNGYIKPWKSNAMLVMFAQVPEIVQDRERLGKYVENCLLMEGFTTAGCYEIAEFIVKANN